MGLHFINRRKRYQVIATRIFSHKLAAFALPQEENMNRKCIVFAFFMVVCWIHLTSCQPTRNGNKQDPCPIQSQPDCEYEFTPYEELNKEMRMKRKSATSFAVSKTSKTNKAQDDNAPQGF